MARFAAVVVLIFLGLLLYQISDGKPLKEVSAVFSSLFSGNSSIQQDRFQRETLAELNQLRSRLKLPPLSVDPDLENALTQIANSQQKPSKVDLNTLFNILRDLFPGAQFLSATVVLDSEKSGLIEDLRSWDDALNSDYESIATHIFKDGPRYGCLAVLTRRLPQFDLATANVEGGRYFNHCPRCGGTHVIELEERSQTLILSCPECGQPYDVLAADLDGNFRRAPEFLNDSFPLPTSARFSSKTPEQRVREIWGEVLVRCDYEYDTKSLNRGEAWKTPAQTWKDRAGDCEDTAILLADFLLRSGIDARVAVGWNVHIGQHAWTVARLGQDQYILETTTRRHKGEELPELLSVKKAKDEYRPEQLFDRKLLYFRDNTADGPQPCVDYWSEREWPSVNLPVGAE